MDPLPYALSPHVSAGDPDTPHRCRWCPFTDHTQRAIALQTASAYDYCHLALFTDGYHCPACIPYSHTQARLLHHLSSSALTCLPWLNNFYPPPPLVCPDVRKSRQRQATQSQSARTTSMPRPLRPPRRPPPAAPPPPQESRAPLERRRHRHSRRLISGPVAHTLRPCHPHIMCGMPRPRPQPRCRPQGVPPWHEARHSCRHYRPAS